MKGLDRLPIPLLAWYRENARVLPWRPPPAEAHWGPLSRVGVGDHAPADQGGGGFGLLPPLYGRTARRGRSGRGGGGPADEAVAGAGLLQPGPQPPKAARQIMADHGASSPAPTRACCPWPAWGIYRRGGGLHRLRTAGSRSGRERAGWSPASPETRATSQSPRPNAGCAGP